MSEKEKVKFLILDIAKCAYYKHGGNGHTIKKHEAARFALAEALQILQALNTYMPKVAMLPAKTFDPKQKIEIVQSSESFPKV